MLTIKSIDETIDSLLRDWAKSKTKDDIDKKRLERTLKPLRQARLYLLSIGPNIEQVLNRDLAKLQERYENIMDPQPLIDYRAASQVPKQVHNDLALTWYLKEIGAENIKKQIKFIKFILEK